MEQLISLPHAAKRLDISVKTLRRLIHQYDVEILRVGKRIRIRETDLNIFARGQKNVEDILTVNF